MNSVYGCHDNCLSTAAVIGGGWGLCVVGAVSYCGIIPP